MSYSLKHPCGNCAKVDKCSDRHFIQGAINGIHDVYPSEKGHFGGGTITIDCQNPEKETDFSAGVMRINLN